MQGAAHHLNQCYQSLSKDSVFSKEVLESSSILFAQQYVALSEKSNGVDWRVKPKMHMFLELCAEGSRPNLFWTYRDEDYGGSIAQLCRMRGRWKKCSLYTSRCLALWRIQNPIPRLLVA